MIKQILLLILILLPALASADSSEPGNLPSANPAVQAVIETMGLRESSIASRDLPGWSVPRKIVVWPIGDTSLEEWQAVAPGVEIVFVQTREEVAAEGADAQAVVGFCNQEFLSRAPEIFWVQVYASGVERCVSIPEMKQGHKLLTNGQRIASPALAEHAIAMMMMLARGLDIYHGNQLEGKWKRQTELSRTDHIELAGRTALVVGLGGIGTQVAKRAHGLGMRVIATRGSRREGPDYVEYVGLADEVNELAAKADVVINTTPLTDNTRGMFDAAFFDAMKSSGYFISVGRGASTVTDDLVAALQSGEIAGAGLDVTDPEPLPEGHPLWTTPRVIISPHTAGRSDKGRERLKLMVMENLRRYVAGEPMLSVVDIERGY